MNTSSRCQFVREGLLPINQGKVKEGYGVSAYRKVEVMAVAPMPEAAGSPVPVTEGCSLAVGLAFIGAFLGLVVPTRPRG